MRVVASANDGSNYSVEVINPLGHPDNPMEDPDIEKKFLTLAEPVIGTERSRAALDAWWHVDDAKDVRQLLQLLDLNSSTTGNS